MDIKSNFLTMFIKQNPDLVSRMRSCDHAYDGAHLNPWHLEGDVWSHTMMVLQSLELCDNEIDNIASVIAVLFHDVGKVFSRYVRNHTRVNFGGHEYASIQYAIDFIYNNFIGNTRDALIWIVTNAISLHREVFSIKDPFTFAGACNFDTHIHNVLGRLMKDDQNGRFYNDNGKGEDFDWSIIKRASDITNTAGIDYMYENISLCDAVVMVGVPGVGKDFFINKYLKNHIVLSYDTLRIDLFKEKFPHTTLIGTELYNAAWKWCNDKNINFDVHFEKIIKSNPGSKFVVSNVNLNRKARKKIVDLFKSCIDDELINIGALYAVSHSEQILKRNNDRTNDKVLEQKVIYNFMRNQNVPNYIEGFVRVSLFCN